MISSPFSFFDKIFVINLDHRTDRWNAVVKEFERIGITNYERFSAKRPNFSDIPENHYNRMTSPARFKILGKDESGRVIGTWNESYIQGSIGCKMSHFEIVKIAKERNYQNVLIFEDDVVFNGSPEKINEIMSGVVGELKPIRWDLCYLSGNHLVPPVKKEGNEFIAQVSNTLTTHAYAINRSVYDIVLQMMDIGAEIDVFYIAIQGQLKNSFCSINKIATQAEGFSDVLNRNVDYSEILK